MKHCLYLILLHMLTFGNSWAASTLVPYSVIFTSPDSRFEAKLEKTNGGSINIFDNRKGLSIQQNVYCPVLYLKWMTDSKSILLIGHISEGTVLQILHLRQGWEVYTIEPPVDFDYHASVLRVEMIAPNLVRLVYKVFFLSPGIGHYYISCSVELNSGKVSNVQKKLISKEEYVRLESETPIVALRYR